MKITLTLFVDDEADVDTSDRTGITNPAYERLVDAIAESGFSVYSLERSP